MRRRSTRSLAPHDAAARSKAESLYFEAAQPLLQQQKFPDAIDILTKATARWRGSAQLELALGVAYYGLRRFDDAAAAFLRTIAIAPEIERPYLFLGNFLGQIPNRLPEVTKQFVRFESAHPDNSAGYLLHAKALNAQSIEPETARKLLEKAISIDDRDASAHFELGIALERLRRYPDALERVPTRRRARPEGLRHSLSPLPRLRPSRQTRRRPPRARDPREVSRR